MLAVRIIISIIILSFTLGAASCRVKAGEDEGGIYGMQAVEPAIAALEKYHLKHNRYPKSWRELIPEYIDKVPSYENHIRFSYYSLNEGGNYYINFTYDGSGFLGISDCTYRPENGWSCVSYI